MPGLIGARERAVITLTSTGAAISNGSAIAVGTDLDARTGGNAPDDLLCKFQLTCQVATVTGIAVDTIIADIYLLPKIDGTNLPTIDVTGGSSALPYSCFVGSFVAVKVPTSAVDMLIVSPRVDLDPLLHTVYLIGRSGQTVSANWTFKMIPWQAQYT